MNCFYIAVDTLNFRNIILQHCDFKSLMRNSISSKKSLLFCSIYIYNILLIVAPYELSLASPKTGLSISLWFSALSFSSLLWRRSRGLSKVSWIILAPSTCGVGLRAEGTGDFSRYPVPTELTEPPLLGLLLKHTRSQNIY